MLKPKIHIMDIELIEKGDSINKGFGICTISKEGSLISRSLFCIFLNKENATLTIGLFFRNFVF